MLQPKVGIRAPKLWWARGSPGLLGGRDVQSILPPAQRSQSSPSCLKAPGESTPCIIIDDIHLNPVTGGGSSAGAGGGLAVPPSQPGRPPSAPLGAPRLRGHMSPLFPAFVSHLLRRGAAFWEASARPGRAPRGDAPVGLFVPFILPGWVCGSLVCLAIRTTPPVRLREMSRINY